MAVNLAIILCHWININSSKKQCDNMVVDINKQKAIAKVISLLQCPFCNVMEGLKESAIYFCHDYDLNATTLLRQNACNVLNNNPSTETIDQSILRDILQLNERNEFMMNDRNYFSWDNLHEMSDINSHITYVSTIVGKYQWDSEAKKTIEQQLRRIIDKQKDKLLNICVIGEFSTGKSSFINALIGYELLAVNSLQGTTIAITMIEYGECFGITITDFNGNSTRTEYADIETLHCHLHGYTTSPKYAHEICYLSVSLPSDILKKGFRIIDTPGTNSLELWHEDITKRAITELSDLSIVLTDATSPMPATLVSFLENTLGSSIKGSAFIANKIDRVRERERDGIIKFIATKVEYNFDITEPLVLPFSSVALTNMFASDKYSVDNDGFTVTTQSLTKLLEYTARNRVRVQARKTLQLMNQIYTTLSHDIGLIASKYKQELSLLERSKQIDLKPFIHRQITDRQKSFIEESRNKKYIVENLCDKFVGSAVELINRQLVSNSTIDNLSDYIKGGQLMGAITREAENITNSVEAKFDDLKTIFRSEIHKFQKYFKLEFERLKILPIKMDVNPRKIDIRRISHTANITPVTMLISEELSKENWAFGGGAAAGAAIGTFILPGIGTALGALAGFIAGGAAAPDIDDVRAKVKSKLEIPLKTYFRSVANDCISNYNTYISDLSNNISSEISRYYSTYSSTILQRLKEWEVQHKAIEKEIKIIQGEIDSIRSRQDSIFSIINKI